MPLLAAVPATVVALYFVWSQPYHREVKWLITLLLLFAGALPIHALRRRTIYSLRTVSGLLSAFREGNYSLRARRDQPQDTLGEILEEINALGEALQEDRYGSIEAAVLLGKVLDGIDIVVMGFDRDQRLRLSNRRAEDLFEKSFAELEGKTASELFVADWLEGDAPRIVNVEFGGRHERWELRRGSYHESGHPHVLLILSDLTPALREEERQAGLRLLRVLHHEVNNSLTPIQSLASSLGQMVAADESEPAWKGDLTEGLAIIANRAKSLGRFLGAYTSLADLPEPTLNPVDVGELVRHVVALETRLKVEVQRSPPLVIVADATPLEQLLINLVQNAVEAAMETAGTVMVSWHANGGGPTSFELVVEDTGWGIANAGNLFVPFYTTKPEGSGIGLVLCRRIAEAHGGTLTLENRPDGPGCQARLRIPFRPWDGQSQK